MVMADLARAIHLPVQMDWMAVSSYGSGTQSSGVVRILKDLDTDISGRHVLVVEDIIDSGLTLSWLVGNLASRGPASVRVCVLLRKPTATRIKVDVAYTGFRHRGRVRGGLWPGLTPSGTATCPSSAPWRPMCTAASPASPAAPD